MVRFDVISNGGVPKKISCMVDWKLASCHIDLELDKWTANGNGDAMPVTTTTYM